MKKCDRTDCSNYTEILHDNHCRTTMEVPEGDCPYFMTVEARARVERYIRNHGNGVGAKKKTPSIAVDIGTK